MNTKWRYCYNYQAAGYIVYRSGKMLRDLFPTREAAIAAVNHLNTGGGIDTIPDPPSYVTEEEAAPF